MQRFGLELEMTNFGHSFVEQPGTFSLLLGQGQEKATSCVDLATRL